MATLEKPMTSKRAGMDDRPGSSTLAAQARVVTKDLQELGSEAMEVVQEKLGELRDGASEYYEEGKAKLDAAEHSIEQFIKEHPLKSVLIAAGAGCLLGRYWMRR